METKPGIATDFTEYQYDRWRSRFLKIMLWVFCVLGLFLILLAYGNASLIGRLLFIAFYAALLAAAFLPFTYEVKTGTLLAVAYAVGVYNLVNWGPWADGVIYFLGAAVLATLLLDNQTYIGVVAATILTTVFVGVLNILGVFPLLGARVPPSTLFDWAIYTLDYSVLAVGLTWGVQLFRRELKIISDRFNFNLQLLTRDRGELEHKVNERTQVLTKKTDQLRAASYIARQTAEVTDLSVLLTTVVNLITDQFGFYHTGVFLINETGDEAVLQAASSEGGKRMIEHGHSLSVGTRGLVGYVAAQKKPRIALDVGSDAVFFNNPDLPMTRSELALPLLIRNRVVGVLDIQSDIPQAFSVDDIDVLQTLADQVAVAIENARLLDESQAALAQLEVLTNLRTRDAWNQKLQGKNRVFTYTPLGLRAEKPSNLTDDSPVIPLTLRGQKIGKISITRKGDAKINKIDEELISEVAIQAGLAIDNIRLLEEATQRAKQEQMVGRLAARFTQSLDIDTLLQTAAREIGQLPDISEVSVFIGKQPEEVGSKRRTKRNVE